MAATFVKFIPDGWESGWNKLWQRTYTTNYRVYTNNRYDGPYTIRAATRTVTNPDGTTSVVPLLPRIGTSYYVSATELDNWAYATDISTKWVGNIQDLDPTSGEQVYGCEWLVTVQYGPYDAGQFGNDPSLWPIRLKFGGTRYERIVLVDRNGVPVLNSADCPFEDPVTVDDSRSSITITRNEPVVAILDSGGNTVVPAFDPTTAETYRDTVNSQPWNGFAADTAKMGTIETSDEQFDSNSGRYYYTVTYPVEINRDTWRKQILDQGTMVYDASGNLVDILDDDGEPVKEGVLLDGTGHELPSSGTPVELPFDVYNQLDFNALDIDFAQAIGRS